VSNKDRNFTRASLAKFIKSADASLDDYLQRLDQSDAGESGTATGLRLISRAWFNLDGPGPPAWFWLAACC
jgi:hypothetical protein